MKQLKVLEELGLLFLSEESAAPAPDTEAPETLVRGDRHCISRHRTLQNYFDPRWKDTGSEAREGRLLFDEIEPDFPPTSLPDRTRFVVLIGAADTPEFQTLSTRSDTVTLVFEPDIEAFGRFAAGLDMKPLLRANTFFFVGDPEKFAISLFNLIPANICIHGFPAFAVQDGVDSLFPQAVERFIRDIEVFYYRHAIESLQGQDNQRGYPLRPLKRTIFFDRLKHHYENTVPCLRGGTLSDLRDSLPGKTALLIGAGPALPAKIEWIRRNRDRAVVIAVNNALRVLLSHGIEPHFTILNDTSIETEKGLEGLPPMTTCRLVSHCLSAPGGDAFPHIHFFGNYGGQIFPKREDLLLYGSVISTAFSLAEYLGCTKAILVGVQLSSPSHVSMTYSAGSIHEDRDGGQQEPTYRYPQLAPIRTADGDLRYTNLNFLDAACFLIDRIRMAALDVINTEPKSIIFGDKITIDPEPELPPSPGIDEAVRALPVTRPKVSIDNARQYILKELQMWREVEKLSRSLAPMETEAQFAEAERRIPEFDSNNLSYLLQRYKDFNNASFHILFLQCKPYEKRSRGARYYFTYMQRMARDFLDILVDQLERLKALEGRR